MKTETLLLARVLRGAFGLFLALGCIRILASAGLGHETSIYVVGAVLGLCFALEALDCALR